MMWSRSSGSLVAGADLDTLLRLFYATGDHVAWVCRNPLYTRSRAIAKTAIYFIVAFSTCCSSESVDWEHICDLLPEQSWWLPGL